MSVPGTLPQFADLPAVRQQLGLAPGQSINVGTFSFDDGILGSPSITFASNRSLGFFNTSQGGNQSIDIGYDGSHTLRFGYNTGSSFAYIQANNNVTGFGYIRLDMAGAVQLISAGANQNIVLVPSGSGTLDIQSTTTWVDPQSSSNASIHFRNSGVFKGIVGYVLSTGLINLSQDGSASAGINVTSNNRVLIGTTTDSGALLQIGTNTTTSAGGIVFGTDTFLFRAGAGTLDINVASGGAGYRIEIGGTVKAAIQFNGTQTQVIDASTTLALFSNNTVAMTFDGSQIAQFNSANSFSANGAVATVLGSVGPTGSHTTVQTWLTFKDNGGVTRYIPCF